jgi:hypothetical protein
VGELSRVDFEGKSGSKSVQLAPDDPGKQGKDQEKRNIELNRDPEQPER